jgi:hypothetical protein
MGNPVDLLFQRAPYAGGPVDLVFGGSNTGPVIPPVNLSLAATLPGPTLTATVQYQSRTQRPTVGQTRTRWQPARETDTGIAQGQQDAAPAPAGWAAFWQRTLATPVSTQVVIPDTFTFAPVPHTARHQDASGLHTAARLINQSATRADQTRQGVFQNATPARHATAFRHQDADRSKRAALILWWQNADQIARGYTSDFQPATALHPAWRGRYQEAQVPPPGRAPWPPILPPFVPRVPSTDLLFACPPWLGGAVELLFGRVCGGGEQGGANRIVPIRKVYIVINNITLHRVDTGAELHAHSFGMSLDYQSWTWSWQASLHADAAAHLGRDAQGDPAEVVAVVNGTPFRLRLVTIARDRRFSPTRWSVSGQGKAAILSAPWAPQLSFGNPSAPRTAQQLATDALTINGVGIGWSVDWGLDDWQVPAGAWALQGSYIDAINDIASSVGGYVQPHATAAVLRVLPRYPAAPWAWGSITPDFEIPEDAAEVEGTQYVDRPAYNRVFVGGVGAGVFGPFTRAGTAGNNVAPQATHPLITDAPAHRQRGVAALSDTGRQEHITLNMQVLPETGVIVPGQFVRYLSPTPKLGIVRSTQIDWSRPKLRQTIKLETHA